MQIYRDGLIVLQDGENGEGGAICPSFVTHTVTHNKKWATASGELTEKTSLKLDLFWTSESAIKKMGYSLNYNQLF